MKKQSFIWAVLVTLVLFCKTGYANIIVPEIDYPLHGIGIGTRAIGMGGAFVAVADDPSAIWWNPAGLSQIERLNVYAEMSYMHEEGEFFYGSYDSINRYKPYSKWSFVPKAIVLTIPYGDIGIGLGAYVPYCTNKEDGEFIWRDEKIKPTGKSKITRAEFSVASGKNNAFNLGLTIGYQWLTTEEISFYHDEYDGHEYVHWSKEEFEGGGLSASIGGIWRIGGNSSIGIAMGTQTPFKGDERYRYYHYQVYQGSVFEDTTYIGEKERERTLPKFLRIGACIKGKKGTIIAAQIDLPHRVYYSSYLDGYYQTFFGLGGAPIRLGIEQPVQENIVLRAGIYSSSKSSYYYYKDVFTVTFGFTVKWRSLRFEGAIENMMNGDDKVQIGSLSALYEL